jgi:glutathione synthase/RimK-type ligase-like ATP-grasp enzyme
MPKNAKLPAQHVFITAPDDSHLNFVTPHMKGANVVIVDPIPSILDQESGLSYEVIKGQAVCIYRGIRLDNVVSVWDRRPTVIEPAMINDVAEPFRGYARSAIRQHAEQIYAQFPGALWISDMYAAQKAELKSGQLAAAHRVGFNVPDTLFTSSAMAAKEFRQRYPAVVIKSIATESPVVGNDLLLFFSTRVERKTKLDHSNLHRGPAIFQRAIKDIKHELRITVVADRVFAATVDLDDETENLSIVRDWRIGHYRGKLTMKPFDDELPQNIKNKCIALVQELGLKFGAIDMILDKRGRYWFLEINPNGQWGFVEHRTGQPIGKAMADLLLSGARRNGDR